MQFMIDIPDSTVKLLEKIVSPVEVWINETIREAAFELIKLDEDKQVGREVFAIEKNRELRVSKRLDEIQATWPE